MPTVITCYATPATAAAPTSVGRSGPGHLLRAEATVAAFGYIEVSHHLTAAGAVHAAQRASSGPTPAVSGSYEVLHAGAQPAPVFAAQADDDPVIFVNCMTFPPAGHDAAYTLWRDVNAYMVHQPGYRWHRLHRLHRRVHPETRFGLVNIVEWESVTAWQAAHDDGFLARATRNPMPFLAQPTLCRPVATVGVEQPLPVAAR